VMAASDSFASGLFDDDEFFQDQVETTSETGRESKKEEEKAPVPEEKVPETPAPEEKAEAPPREEESSQPQEERKPRERHRRKGREGGGSKERGRPRREREGARGERKGAERHNQSRPSSPEGVHSSHPFTTPSGVATGVGAIPAGTLVHQRVLLLVDADLLDREAQDTYQAKVSYRKVFSHTVLGRRAIRAIAYMSEEEEDARAPFQDHLSTSGFEKVKRVGPGRGDWAVRLTLDAVDNAPKADAVVIASSQAALLPLVEKLKAQGCRVEVASFLPPEENPLAQGAEFYLRLGRSCLYVP